MGRILNNNEIFFTTMEPHTSNRFLFEVDGIPAYLIKKASAPSFDAGEIVLDHINIQRKLKGKVKWNDVNLELYSPITPSGAQAVMEWLRLSHESVTGRDGYNDFYKKDCSLSVLGPVGDVVGSWKLKGAFLKTGAFGEFDFANEQYLTISVSLGMDYAILEY